MSQKKIKSSHSILSRINRWELILICLILAIVILFDVGLTGMVTEGEIKKIPNPVLNLTCPEPICPEPKCDCKEPICYNECPDYPKLPLFMEEARAIVAAHDWQKKQYMCCDFSVELFNRLTSDGYKDVKFCEGKLDEIEHCWVKIGNDIVIETVNSNVINPKEYVKHYEEEYCINYIPYSIMEWVRSYGDDK